MPITVEQFTKDLEKAGVFDITMPEASGIPAGIPDNDFTRGLLAAGITIGGPGDDENLRNPIEEIGSAIGSGVVGTGESVAGLGEMLHIPGAESARKWLQEVGESEVLKRPEYLSDETVVEHPERLIDWRWWVRSLGENVPNMAAMMLPGLAAWKGAQLLKFGPTAIDRAAKAGAWLGAATIEAGSAYNQAKEEMTAEGRFSDTEIERTATAEGITVGVVNAIFEILPFDNLFLKNNKALHWGKQLFKQVLIEGTTEIAQETWSLLVQKWGHKPDQKLLDNIGQILESGIIGFTLGGFAGGVKAPVDGGRKTDDGGHRPEVTPIDTGMPDNAHLTKDIGMEPAMEQEAEKEHLADVRKRARDLLNTIEAEVAVEIPESDVEMIDEPEPVEIAPSRPEAAPGRRPEDIEVVEPVSTPDAQTVPHAPIEATEALPDVGFKPVVDIEPDIIPEKSTKKVKPEVSIDDLEFIDAGDAVGREYHGNIVAYHKDTGSKIGYIDYSYLDGETSIQMIKVEPEYRRTGVGSMLLDKLQEEAGDTPITQQGDFATKEGKALFESWKKKNTVHEIPGPEPTAIAKEPLIQEALKYETAAEFVDAQEIFFHATTEAGLKSIQKEGVIPGKALKGPVQGNKWGFSISKKKPVWEKAKGVLEFFIDPEANIAKGKDIPDKFFETLSDGQVVFNGNDVIPWAKENGYDGIDLEDIEKTRSDFKEKPSIYGILREVQIFNPDMLKTKTQLTDIWNKVHKPIPAPKKRGKIKLPEPTGKWKRIEDATKSGELWRLTGDDFIDQQTGGGRLIQTRAANELTLRRHKKIVEQAITEGKITSHPDYPELTKSIPAPKKRGKTKVPSIAQWIAENGGLKDTSLPGELRDMITGMSEKTGKLQRGKGVPVGFLNNKTGLGFDEWLVNINSDTDLKIDTESELIQLVERDIGALSSGDKKARVYVTREGINAQDDLIAADDMKEWTRRQEDLEKEARDAEIQRGDIEGHQRSGETEASGLFKDEVGRVPEGKEGQAGEGEGTEELDEFFDLVGQGYSSEEAEEIISQGKIEGESSKLKGKKQENLIKKEAPFELTGEQLTKTKGMIEGHTPKKAVMPEEKIRAGLQGEQKSLVAKKGETKGLFDEEPAEVKEPGEVFETGIENEKEGVKSGQVAYIPEQTSLFDLIEKETKEKTNAGTVPGQRVQNRPRGTFASPGRVLRNTEDFATLVAPTRRSAQEIAFIAIVDKDGNILEVEKYSKGAKNRASVSADEIVGRAMNIEGADKIYFAHNHPSASTKQSEGDLEINRFLRELAATADIDVDAIIIADTEYVNVPSDAGLHTVLTPKKIKPALRRESLDLVERFLIKSKGLNSREKINNVDDAMKALAQYGDNEDGVLFLNAQNQPVVFMPFVKGSSSKKITADIIRLSQSAQAPYLIINQSSDEIRFTQYLRRLVNITTRSDIKVYDIFKQGKSLQSMGIMPTATPGQDFYSTTTPGKTTITPPTIEDVRRIFKGQRVRELKDGHFGIMMRNGLNVDVKTVDLINEDAVSFELGYHREKKAGEEIAGAYKDGKILLRRGLAGTWTLDHEGYHLIEELGLISPAEVRTLKQKIRALHAKGAFAPMDPATVGFAEDRANYVADRLEGLYDTKSTTGKIIQKIRVFLDNLLAAFGIHTSGGVVRKIESGRVFNEPVRVEKSPDIQGQSFYSVLDSTPRETTEDVRANRTFVNKIHSMRNLAGHRIGVETTALQKKVQGLAGPASRKKIYIGFGAHKTLKRSMASDDLDRAMMLYRDTGGDTEKIRAFREQAQELIDNRATDNDHRSYLKKTLRVLDVAENLTDEQRAFADDMGVLFEDAYATAKAHKIVQTHRDNYVRRIYKTIAGRDVKDMRGSGTGQGGFKTGTTAANQRVYDTILDAVLDGYQLGVTGITNSYDTYMKEIAEIIANKAFIQAGVSTRDLNGNALFTTEKKKGYEPLNASGFAVWRWAGKAEIESEFENDEALVVDTYGRKFFATIPERIPESWSVYKDADAQRPSKKFDMEEDAIAWAKEKGYERVERNIPKDVSQLFEKQPLYAPAPIADMINKMTKTDDFFSATPGAKELLRLNAGVKSWILITSLFHHVAGARSWVFGVHYDWKDMNPVTAHIRGLKKIAGLDPLIDLAIRNGLTLGELQDWSEYVLREQKGLTEKLATYLGMEKTVKVIEHGKFYREKAADSLFKRYFAGLKAEAFCIEYGHALNKATEEYTNGRIPEPPNPDLIAEQTARLINADFGGLHLKRMGRNPTLQNIFRLAALAPDWCTLGDTRAMTKTGWKYYWELDDADEIMAFDPDGETLHWSKMKDKYVNEHYTGPMVRVSNHNRAIVITPPHTCYVYNISKKKNEVVSADKLNTAHRIPRSAAFHELPELKMYSDYFVRLAGWLVTDGYIKRSKCKLADGTTTEYHYGKITQSKPKTVQMLKDLGLIYHVDSYNSDHGKFKAHYKKHVFTIPKDIFTKMQKIGLENGLNWGFLNDLTKEQLEILYDTMMLGDGTGQGRFSGKEKIVFYMTLIQTLLGRPTTFYQQEKYCWRTRVLKESKHYITCANTTTKEDHSNVPIWCPSVDTGFWLAEREGLVFITGNTESNFRTVTGMIPGMNKLIDKMTGGVPGPPGMDTVYRKFWGRVIFRIAALTVLSQILLNGKDDTEEFYKEQLLTDQRTRKKLRWTEVDITKLYNALGIDTEGQRKTFSPGGHFFDPLKLIDPPRLIKGKASPAARVGGAWLSGSDWAGRSFTGAGELLRTGKTVTKSPYEKKSEGLTFPSMVVNQIVNMQPIQMGHLLKYIQGEEDGLTAIMHSAGAPTHTAWKPRITTPVVKAKTGDDPVYAAITELADRDVLHMDPPSRTVVINGISRAMSSDQYEKYMEDSSEIVRRKLKATVTSKIWEKYTDSRRIRLIGSVIRNARRRVRARIKRMMGRKN